MNYKPISIDELPRHSAWPAILLGVKPFLARQRTREAVLREYEKDKWGLVLSWLRTRSVVTTEDLLREQGLDSEQVIPFARDDCYYLAPARVVMELYGCLLHDTLQKYQPEALVELGCGLGDKLLELSVALRPRVAYGGEFTGSGVECGRILAKLRGLAVQFDHFDYNDPQTLHAVPKDALVYTSHSIEQIPYLLDSFIEGLIHRTPRLVIHFEPCYQDQNNETLIGLMRQRYTELNDYNRNLFGLLRSFEQAGRIRILFHRPNVFSDTPFNPTSIIAWSPT